jgi:hypothetical protein
MLMAICARRSTLVKAVLGTGDRKVCVEDRGSAMGTQRLFQAVHAEPGLKGVG